MIRRYIRDRIIRQRCAALVKAMPANKHESIRSVFGKSRTTPWYEDPPTWSAILSAWARFSSAEASITCTRTDPNTVPVVCVFQEVLLREEWSGNGHGNRGGLSFRAADNHPEIISDTQLRKYLQILFEVRDSFCRLR